MVPGSPMPSWSIPAVVSEVRKLETDKGRVWAHSVKLIAMGGTYEAITTKEEIARLFGDGEQCVAIGTFEIYNGRVKLVLTGKADGAAAAPPRSPTGKPVG